MPGHMILSDPFPFAARFLQKTILESLNHLPFCLNLVQLSFCPLPQPPQNILSSQSPGPSCHGQPWTLVLPDPQHHDMLVPTTAFS